MPYLERFQDKAGSLFIKFPLISNLINERGWAATKEANERYAYSAIGKPLTLMFNKEDSLYHDYHPFSKDISLEDKDGQINFARKYEYGHIVDVGKGSSSYKTASGEVPWFAVAKITDPTMAEEWKKPNSRLVPPAFSPGIIQLEGPDNAISKYEILHVASVPSGAFGPRFVALGKCVGSPETCAPQLRAASISYSYKERCGICPKDVFSSLLLKTGSSSDNNMSFSNSAAPGTPAPQSYGTAEVRSPSGETMATQNTMPSQSKKPTLYIKKLRLTGQNQANQNQSTEPQPNGNGEQPEEGGEGQGEQSQQQQLLTDNQADRAFRSSRYYAEMQAMKKQLEQRTAQWDYKEKRYQLEKIIKPSLFQDGKGRFMQKQWEAEIDKAIKENIPIEWLKMYYANKEQLMQVPELQVKRASSPSYDGLVTLQGASSLEADEERIKARKALELNGGF